MTEHLRVRQSDGEPTSETHQGQRRSRSESPNVRLQSTFQSSRTESLAKPGASMYGHSYLVGLSKCRMAANCSRLNFVGITCQHGFSVIRRVRNLDSTRSIWLHRSEIPTRRGPQTNSMARKTGNQLTARTNSIPSPTGSTADRVLRMHFIRHSRCSNVCSQPLR